MGDGNDDKRSGKPKRSVACASCRRQKSKCIISHKDVDPPRCDRCIQTGIECKFEIRANDKQWTVSVEERLKQLEDGFQELLETLQSNTAWGASPIAENFWHRHNARQGTVYGADEDGSNQDVAAGVKRSASRDMANGFLSSIMGRQESSSGFTTPEPPRKRQRNTNTPDVVARDIVSEAEAQELITFFNNKVSRYLPILVFKYMPQFDMSIRDRSPILFVSILAVASLYYSQYQDKFSTFRAEFEMQVDNVTEHNVGDMWQTIDTILALSLGGAWLGGEVGFKMSLKASDIAGTVLPPLQESLGGDSADKKEMISAVGLMTYIIEQRLRIIHARPVDPSQVVNGQRRDVFFAQFLASQMAHRKSHHEELDVAELKITANVELCACILMLQLDLYREIKMAVIDHWNNQLDKWLAEWMGKLTVNLLPSSWKPVFLTFHFAKMFVNSLAVSNVKPNIGAWQPPVDEKMGPEERSRLVKVAENSALDILDMLVRDRDIDRLVGVGPVFYPTIFITACAFLLKLLAVCKSINYEIDVNRVLTTIREAHNVLSSKIPSSVLPCYQSIKNLGSALVKVSQETVLDVPSSNQVYQPFPAAPQQQPQQQHTNPQPVPQAFPPELNQNNIWSFTPFRQGGIEHQLPLDIDTQAIGGLQNIWQNNSGNAGGVDFLMDAYSASLLDSLTDPATDAAAQPPGPNKP